MLLLTLVPMVLSQAAFASGGEGKTSFDLTSHWVGIACVAIFVFAYILVMLEEVIHLRKSKPVLVAAGFIWLLVAWILPKHGAAADFAEHAVRHNLLEYAELFLFLLAAMTYINTMEERRVFDALRAKLVGAGLSLRQIFWVTGLLAFFISPIADNLTTALLMGAVAMSVGAGNVKFVAMACINIVIAANAGGAFSPFGDITTLMVWQKGLIPFAGFFALFLPAVVNWLVPAIIMTFFLEKGQPAALDEEVKILEGGIIVVFMFLGTIALAVSFHNFFHMPPVIGMMTGLGFLKFFGYFLKRRAHARHLEDASASQQNEGELGDEVPDEVGPQTIASSNPFEAMSHAGSAEEDYDIFKRLEKAEWDTLMFFYGVILCVGGLSTLGYLAKLSTFAYEGMGPTTANIGVGFLSAIVDNIPVMFAVLTMMPEMDAGQWLLATLTAGVGGSMLSIGSAAGVALMGQARGIYTFGAHLKWAPVIALGYFASIGTHYALNMQEPGAIVVLPGAKAKAAAPPAAHDDNLTAEHGKKGHGAAHEECEATCDSAHAAGHVEGKGHGEKACSPEDGKECPHAAKGHGEKACSPEDGKECPHAAKGHGEKACSPEDGKECAHAASEATEKAAAPGH